MKIAIKGDKSRGKEVIQILESLGGNNEYEFKGYSSTNYYFISSLDNMIYCHNFQFINKSYKTYTLEEFEKEFPFKIGDKVITTLGHIGIIINIIDNKYEVFFKIDSALISPKRLKPYKEMKEERNITLTLDKAKEWYNKGGELREVALQAYSEKELTKIELPKSWEEFCNNYPVKETEAIICYDSTIIDCSRFGKKRDSEIYKYICPSKESAEAHLALIQLEQLRDCYRQGDIPQEIKYKIRKVRNKYTVVFGAEDAFLSFCDLQTAEEFLECFKDLIEVARDLI